MKLASEWTPSSTALHCTSLAQLANALKTYNLAVTPIDQEAVIDGTTVSRDRLRFSCVEVRDTAHRAPRQVSEQDTRVRRDHVMLGFADIDEPGGGEFPHPSTRGRTNYASQPEAWE